MNHILVIVESPAKCKKIESYLGQGYKCIASYGHLREIKDLTYIDTKNNFTPNYTIIDQSIKLKQIEILRKEIKNASEIILATDDDREGESIAWHICQLFDLSVETTKRIIFHEISEKAIQTAIQSPKHIQMDIVNAQKGRQILDLLVGFKVTPLLWENIAKNHKNSLSAGRCQTPALRIVYDNYLDINKDTKKQLYNITGYFTNHHITFELNKEMETKEDVIDFLNNTIHFDHYLTVSEPKQSFISQPQPLITSSLQQLCSNELHWSPKETMKHAQELYENGLITYMRTDSKIYSSDFIIQAKDYILRNFNDPKYLLVSIDQLSVKQKEKESKTKKEKEKEKDDLSQEAHEAIRPVDIFLKAEDIKEDINLKAKKLYTLIWSRSLESCMSPSIAYYINANIPAYSDLNFKCKMEETFFLGWKAVKESKSNKNTEQNSGYHYLNSLKQKIKVNYKKIVSNTVFKNNKLHLTEASLIHLLEEKGIGRPSTYSSLVDKIQERGYVSKENIPGKQIKCEEFTLVDNELTKTIVDREFGAEKNKLIIQPLGILVIEFLLSNCSELFEYGYTKQMESDLDLVANGNKKYWDICKICDNLLDKLTNGISTEKYKVKIDDRHSYIIGKHGPVIKQVINNKTTFLPVKKDIDIKRLEKGEYELQDLLEQSSNKTSILLGKYKGADLYLKEGKYGIYAQWNENNTSLKELGKMPLNKITLIDVLKVLEKEDILDPSAPVGLVRTISENISIRSGKFGDYIFYKNTNKKMKNPQFYKLKDFKGDYKNGDMFIIKQWIKGTYNIE